MIIQEIREMNTSVMNQIDIANSIFLSFTTPPDQSSFAK